MTSQHTSTVGLRLVWRRGVGPGHAPTWRITLIAVCSVLLSRCGSGAGVRLVVTFTQTLGCYMRVNLGCPQTLVSQELLHAPDIRTGIEQVSGETVPERVRG